MLELKERPRTRCGHATRRHERGEGANCGPCGRVRRTRHIRPFAAFPARSGTAEGAETDRSGKKLRTRHLDPGATFDQSNRTSRIGFKRPLRIAAVGVAVGGERPVPSAGLQLCPILPPPPGSPTDCPGIAAGENSRLHISYCQRKAEHGLPMFLTLRSQTRLVSFIAGPAISWPMSEASGAGWPFHHDRLARGHRR